MVFSGASLPAVYTCLKVGPLGPAGGAAEGPNRGMVHRARPTTPPLVLMCYFRLDNITKWAGTVRGAVGRARCTIPQFGPLGGPTSRPERANFEDTVRSRKCDSRKYHYL